MALTDKKREYYRNYREQHKDMVKASNKRWYESGGKDRYRDKLELSRAIGRKCYYKSVGNEAKMEAEERLIQELRLKFPRGKGGPKQKFSHEENYLRRKATVRKVRYRHVKGVSSLVDFIEPEKCQVCSGTKKICMDHDHDTNQFRGWLCDDCNLSIGRAKENPEILEAMARYLRKHKGEG